MVDHEIPLTTMESCGIKALHTPGSNHSFINEHREWQEQRMVGDLYKSGVRSVAVGVPQSGVVGPYLFIIHTNDLCLKQ